MQWSGWLRTSSVALTVLFGATLRAQETQRRAIAADVVIDGVPCARTDGAPAEFYPSGRLHECPLSRDAKIATQAFPHGSWVLFREDGTLYGAWLSRDATLSGHGCKGEGYKKWSLRFHPTGALRSCYLPETTMIEGVPCREGTFWGEIRGRGQSAAFFFANGRLQRCLAARAFTLAGVHYDKWSVVVRDSAP